jgi:hypothetical protein
METITAQSQTLGRFLATAYSAVSLEAILLWRKSIHSEVVWLSKEKGFVRQLRPICFRVEEYE